MTPPNPLKHQNDTWTNFSVSHSLFIFIPKMANFKIQGNDLLDNHSHKIATLRGNDLYDEHSHKVATIRGIDIYDERSHKVATLKGSDVYDEHSRKVSTISDIKRNIDQASGGASLVAFWWFFVR